MGEAMVKNNLKEIRMREYMCSQIKNISYSTKSYPSR